MARAFENNNVQPTEQCHFYHHTTEGNPLRNLNFSPRQNLETPS